MVLRRSSRSPGRGGATGTQGGDGKASRGDRDAEFGPDSEAGGTDLVRAFVDEITWYMSEHKMSRADLAQSMAVSPGRVSQILSGEDNLTLRTLSAVVDALGAGFEISLHPVEDTGQLTAGRD
jgi:Helix-turn-helix